MEPLITFLQNHPFLFVGTFLITPLVFIILKIIIQHFQQKQFTKEVKKEMVESEKRIEDLFAKMDINRKTLMENMETLDKEIEKGAAFLKQQNEEEQTQDDTNSPDDTDNKKSDSEA